MAGAVEVHHLPVALCDASLRESRLLKLMSHAYFNRRTETHLDFRKLSQVRVHAGHRLVRDALVIVQPQSVCVLTKQHVSFRTEFCFLYSAHTVGL